MTRADNKNKLVSQAEGASQAATPSQTIAAYLKKMEPTFAEVLPKHIDKERLLRIALTTIRTNPKLLECTIPSLMASVMQSATLGLEPGLLGHCYFLPFKNNRTGTSEVQFIIGYKGMIDLARRSGNIQSISAHEVYENDFFELIYGLDENLKHIPWHTRSDERFDQPGMIRGAYMVAKFKDGGHYIHYMPKQEIDLHRARSKSANNGPWVSDYIEMCKKTVVRSGWKWLPISIEMAEQVVRSDESVRKDITETATSEVPIIEYNADDLETQPQQEESEVVPEEQQTLV
ncbi:recombination protein RecT [Fodinisporobacter ferrooxydans]|uniref:Recombination protein RecT n=2 Tax=Fodinisporobacter ferrooxydans TaxID=2901836 RepID=A0ABY4CMR5_9BACL|nr:recombination protein RecT [Alicyclobacillaceae bacterium MYW30-H2]